MIWTVRIILLTTVACKHYLVELEAGKSQQESPDYSVLRPNGESTAGYWSAHLSLMLQLQVVPVDVWKHLELELGYARPVFEGGHTTIGEDAGCLFMVAVVEMVITSGAQQNVNILALKNNKVGEICSDSCSGL